jgi:hypothetical protein
VPAVAFFFSSLVGTAAAAEDFFFCTNRELVRSQQCWFGGYETLKVMLMRWQRENPAGTAHSSEAEFIAHVSPRYEVPQRSDTLKTR